MSFLTVAPSGWTPVLWASPQQCPKQDPTAASFPHGNLLLLISLLQHPCHGPTAVNYPITVPCGCELPQDSAQPGSSPCCSKS